MFNFTGEQLQKSTGQLRAEARRAPVEITYHGRPELVVLSVEDYALLRQNRKLAFSQETMPAVLVAGIAASRMDDGHENLNSLMDD